MNKNAIIGVLVVIVLGLGGYMIAQNKKQEAQIMQMQATIKNLQQSDPLNSTQVTPVAGAQPAEQQGTVMKYTDPLGQYGLVLPAGWQVKNVVTGHPCPGCGEESLVITNNADNGATISATLHRNEESVNDTLLDFFLANPQSILANYKIPNINGNTAYKRSENGYYGYGIVGPANDVVILTVGTSGAGTSVLPTDYSALDQIAGSISF